MVAIEPSVRSGGECCRDPASNLEALVGERLGPDFSKKLSLVFGGPRGCSHLLTLFFFMAAAVPRALEFEREQARVRGAEREIGECAFQRSLSLDGHEDAAGDVELAVQLGDYHMCPERMADGSAQRLDHEHDIRLYARVRSSDQVLGALRVAERERDRDSLATAEWRERPEWGQSLIDAPILSGFAARVLQTCAADPEQRLLSDALLQLAPGHFQVLAAFADRWAAGTASPNRDGQDGAASRMTANCYMWRPGGALGPL